MREHGFMHYLETSAKSGQNVNELFQTITKHLFITHEANLDKFVSPSFHWSDERKQKDEDDQTEPAASFVSLNQPKVVVTPEKKKKKCCGGGGKK